MKTTTLPVDCVLAITYNCNARCVMCDIWKIKGFPELPVAEYKKLPSSLKDVNISGGEPFLRKDLPEIVATVKEACPRARIVISSNAFLTDLVLQQMKKILAIKHDIGIAISIDGLDEKHNEMRGIPGGFARCMATVEGLQKMGMKNIRLGFTITERNASHLLKVYELTRKLGIQFTHSFAQSSDFYFGGKQNDDFVDIAEESLTEGMAVGAECRPSGNPLREMLQKQYENLIKSELKTWDLKKWVRAYFAYGMFITCRNPVLSNAPGRDFFFLDPNGIVYPSVVHNYKMGNIRKMDSFEKFWFSDEVEKTREKIDASKLPVWMICTSRTAIKKHPLNVMAWILKNKFFGFSFAKE